ncbi:MAG: DUF4382 domain-containing protein [Planctomycetota bacterium]
MRPPIPCRIVVPFVLLGLTAACERSSSSVDPPPITGEVSVSIGDPPICESPVGDIDHVYVTVTRVRVHASDAAVDDDGGWVDLIDRRDDPLVLDLLDQSETECVLATLGAARGLPAGSYGQVRLYLLANDPPMDAVVPDPNPCGSEGYNCVGLSDGSLLELLLGSQAKTGLKIPPGRIAGGRLLLSPLANVELHIDFDACASIVFQGNGQPRLKPTLFASLVGDRSEVAGRLVDQGTGAPFTGLAVVTAQVVDDEGIARVIRRVLPNADGTFRLCPLPGGQVDLVASGVTVAGVAFGPTVLANVPVGTNVGDLPLRRSIDPDPFPASIEGLIRVFSVGDEPSGLDVALSVLQTVDPPDRPAYRFTAPLLPGSDEAVATVPSPDCEPADSCATFREELMAAHPLYGRYATSGVSYSQRGLGPIDVTVEAVATAPSSGGLPTCRPSTRRIVENDLGQVLTIVPGQLTRTEDIDFDDCED